MEGLDISFGELSTHGVEKNAKEIKVQEWTEAELEADYDKDTFPDGGKMPDWLDKMSLEDIEKINNIDDLRELRSMIVGDPFDIPDDNEGFQKVKRW